MPRYCGDINEAERTCKGELWGHEVRGVYDGVLYWACTAGHVFARNFGDWERLNILSRKYAAERLANLQGDAPEEVLV